MPDDPELDFHSLDGGKKFLLRFNARNAYGENRGPEIWFGGTEENPFLVKLESGAFDAFKVNGEVGFFGSLKPAVISRVEELFNAIAKRQGDIFAVPLSLNLADFARVLAMVGNHNEPVEFSETSCHPIFGTRHLLKGFYQEVALFGGVQLLGRGVIEAPDHSPLELNGIHLLAQATNLINPKLAD